MVGVVNTKDIHNVWFRFKPLPEKCLPGVVFTTNPLFKTISSFQSFSIIKFLSNSQCSKCAPVPKPVITFFILGFNFVNVS